MLLKIIIFLIKQTQSIFETMETLRLKRKITSTRLKIDELSGWFGKEVDIIIREKPVLSNQEQVLVGGALHEFRDKSKLKEESSVWERVVNNKYGNR